MLLTDYKLLTKTIGIYAFHNLENNKYYVGQSQNIRKRIFHHISCVNKD